jgi:prevent-host-death family protein
MPMLLNPKTVDMMDLRRKPGSIVDQVFYRHEAFVVERSGEPKAVLVPLGEYQEMRRRKLEARKRLTAMIAEVRTRVACSGISEDELQKTIDEAVEKVRSESAPYYINQ